ncbi:MAG: AmmeMemoRadiSam system protein B [Burkholderiales bacterium]
MNLSRYGAAPTSDPMIATPARTRPPAVAGSFYPAFPEELAAEVRSLLADAPAATGPVPKAIIAPHAGYVYSGPTAAAVYARLAPARDRFRRVILLGPVHRVAVRGLALPGADSFATPLGRVALDVDAMNTIVNMPQVCVSAAAHAQEHSLEVHLPFLQTVLAEFTLVPLAVGDATAEEVAGVLERLWGGDETLIVVSSDLSHFLGYADAQTADRRTAAKILALQENVTHHEACGGTPVNGLALAARRHGLAPALVDLRNSGDTAGDKQRVVGYGAFTYTPAA